MDYHGRIMNIEVDAASMAAAGKPRSLRFAFKAGHRDARHAAAEIALEAQAEIARLKDGERKYAVALTKDQGEIDWRKWMLVPVTECEFIPKAKHDAEIARLSNALKSAAAFLTWCLEETPIGKPPEIGPDVLAKCRAALAQVAEVPE